MKNDLKMEHKTINLDSGSQCRYLIPIMTLMMLGLMCSCGERKEVAEHEEITIRPSAKNDAHTAFKHPTGTMPDAPAIPRTPVAGEKLAWTTPENWKEMPGQGMRLATFEVPGEKGKAECSLIVLTGSAGGLKENVSRWIGQLEMAMLSEEELGGFLENQTKFTTTGGDSGVLVDLTPLEHKGDDSMIAGVISRSGQTIFAKLSGPRTMLLAERERLLALCSSFN